MAVAGLPDDTALAGLAPFSDICAALRIQTVICGLDAPIPPPASTEMAALGDVAPVRARDFAAGRYCARLALAKLGREAKTIPIGGAGEPVWPEGIVGSISHSAGLAGAVVAEATGWRALGFDIDADDAVGPELYDLVLTPIERAEAPGRHEASLIFSAKEAVYKAAHPLLRRWIGFDQVRIICTGEREFRAEAIDAQAGLDLLETGEGYFFTASGHVFALFGLRG